MNSELDTKNGTRIRIHEVMFSERVVGKIHGSYAFHILLIQA